MKEEKIKEIKSQLFDLQVLLGQVNSQIQGKLKELNDLQRDVCLPSTTSQNK